MRTTSTTTPASSTTAGSENIPKAIEDRTPQEIQYIRQGPFTIAIVRYQSGLIGVGVTKAPLNKDVTTPEAGFVAREGRKLAVKRANPNPRLTRFVQRE